MKYVAIYRREGNGTPLTILKDSCIRQIGTAEELGLGSGKMLFIQIDRFGYGFDYYSASAYRALEVDKSCQDKN